MPFRLILNVFVAVFLAMAHPAFAEDAGEGGTNGDSAGDASGAGESASDGAVIDADIAEQMSLACDGALCETRSGSTCAVIGGSPGQPDPVNPLAVFVVTVALAIVLARKKGRGTTCPS
jgi:hypothetical protein